MIIDKKANYGARLDVAMRADLDLSKLKSALKTPNMILERERPGIENKLLKAQKRVDRIAKNRNGIHIGRAVKGFGNVMRKAFLRV